ncbi:solute carrier family 40 member 1 [Striga asiatica]|uniref:Solute carrier family 40 member 1 n=1 Tax=Striga asiatica TaxID=4170 RepID=A0A5A7REA5_STRAF|nr:solute carrier family 40 member 1 [Striga asiatica]
MWEFSVALYMIKVWPESLLLAAAYGLSESASMAIFGPLIGHWVDNLSYIQVLKIWLLSQNLSFIIAGSAVIAILIHPEFMSTNRVPFFAFIVIINISGAIGVLSTLAGTILVEREWVVVISKSQPPGILTNMNSLIRRIDLSCKLFAPVISGFIISFVSLMASAFALALWNILSVHLQYRLLISVYNGIPGLREADQKRASRFSVREVDEKFKSLWERKSLIFSDENDHESISRGTIIKRLLKISYISAWRLYIEQDIVLPGLALALLYFTVLSFGTLMTAYLEWEGISAYVIGTGRGFNAIVGISATFLYPILQSRISTLITGLWSIWSQCICLLLCVASVFVKDKLVSAYMLMGGVVSSRLGLWMFDLSDRVAEPDRCIVGGVQNSLQSILDLMTYIMGIVISNPQSKTKNKKVCNKNDESAIVGSRRRTKTTFFFNSACKSVCGPLFSQMGCQNRMWEFSVGLYMINVWPDSLLLTAAYGIVESSSTALLGPLIGQCVDKFTYVQVLKIWLFSQNLSFMLAGGSVIAVLTNPDLISVNRVAFTALVLLINFSGAIGVLSTLAGTILIEREWVVVISEGQPPRILTNMNANIRRIDLTCKLLAPVASGFIVSFISLTSSAVALVLWNTLSVFLQYLLLMSVYNGIPKLEEVSQRRAHKRESSIFPGPDQPETSSNRAIISRFLINNPYISAWGLYVKQDFVVLPGLALALLYFTVLSFGTLMTVALEWEGIEAYIIGTMRGISAAVGILATFVYPIMEFRISTLRTGLWSIWSQWTCLLPCVASVFVKEKRLVSAYLLMGGVALSRLGLWMFDLSVIQQMQDHVAESDRCVVGGVQNSLQSMLDLMTYVMGLLISNPQDFWKLTMLSFVVVTLAAALYSLHIYRVRKHLLHLDKLFSFIQRAPTLS